MIINNGPIGSKFNPKKDLLFKTSSNSDFVSYDIASASGCCLLEQNGKNWDLKILENCYIQFIKKFKGNIFLVGGGAKGKTGNRTSDSEYSGGAGGNGGNCLLLTNQTVQKLENYQCIIGLGSTDQSTRGGSTKIVLNENTVEATGGLNETIDNRDYGIGGAGGGYNNGKFTQANTNATKINGYYYHNKYYGAGGGGGSATNHNAPDNFSSCHGGAGGITGGGNGAGYYNGSNYSGDAQQGQSNYGAGGGGGKGSNYSGSSNNTSGGNGGSGVIIISNY